MKLRPVLSALAAVMLSLAAVAQLAGDAGDLRARAERGDVKAQLALGRSLAATDPVEAFAWLTLALERGEASDEHAKLFRELTPAQYATAEKRALELRSRFGEMATPVVSASVALANENADLKAQVEKLTREINDARAIAEGAALVRARVGALEKELTAARSEAAVRDSRAGEASTQLRRDLDAAMQQRDTLAEQLSQARRERASAEMDRETLRAELANLRTQPAPAPASVETAATTPAPAAPAADSSGVDVAELQRALREAQMKVDMTVRAFAIKDEENQRSTAKVEQAAHAQAAAESARSEALANVSRLESELAAAKQSEASAVAAKSALQNELYAAQIRIENYSRAFARTGGTVGAAYGTPTSAPVALESSGATIDSPRASAPASSATPLLADAPAGDSTSTAAAGPRTHKVAEGETLSLLAFKYYGSPNKWDRIFNANRAKLKSADQVRPGIVLVIP